MSLNIKQIKQNAINNLTFERGLDYFEDGRVDQFNIDYKNQETILTAVVQGSKERKYQITTTIHSDDRVDHQCECESSQTSKKACKHIIAVLLKYYYHREDKLEKSTEVKTDSVVSKIIAHYAKQNYRDEPFENSYRKVELIPMIERDYYNNVYLNFSIGIDKTYVIKNVNKLFTDIKTESFVEYGKNLTINHRIESFSEESIPLVKFFLKTYGNYYFYALSNKNNTYESRNLLLSPSSFDEFFILYLNKQVIFKNQYLENAVHFIDELPEIVLRIKEATVDTFLINLNIKKVIIMNGENYEYYLLSNKLHRVPHSYKEKLDILIKTLNTKDEGLIIHKNDMRTFFTNVISEIKDLIQIDVDPLIIDEYTPIPLYAKLYLDANEFVTGKLIFSYNDEEFIYMNEVIQLDSIRNYKEEYYLKNLVSKYFENFDKETKEFYSFSDDYIYNLYVEGLDILGKRLQIFATDSFKNKFKKLPVINIGVKLKHDLLEIDLNTNDFSLEELFDILSAYNHNKKFHRLKDGSLIDFHDSDLGVISQFTDVLDISKKEFLTNDITIPKYRALYLDNLLKSSHKFNIVRDNEFNKVVRDITTFENNDFDIPENLKNILRNYQKVGFNWLKTISLYGFGGILADDMGLGKTIEIISLLQSYIDTKQDLKPSLVVSPASLVLNWQMEINHFAHHISVLTIIGNYEQRKELIDRIPDYDVVVTSYDYLKRDIELYQNYEFMYHVIDEAQYIKNNATLNARSVKQIKSTCRFALTGTPIENNLAEIWSIFDFVMPGYLYSYRKFFDKFENDIVKNENLKTLDKLRKLVTPFVLRRLKKDVLQELPDKTETTMYVELEGEQKKLYLANLLKIKLELDERIEQDGLNNSKILILSMLTRLRQLCCDPLLYYDDYKGESVKREMCLELIQTSTSANHKILLFSQFTSMLAILADELDRLGISYYVLEGKTPKEERIRLVDAFNNDQTSVFLISLKAGGTGLNLTSADVVIHYDPWWNISAQNQATDRTHRIGQKNHVQVYKLITKDTIEEKILKMQESKSKLADSIIVADDGIIANMSFNEIFDLFSDESL